MSTIRPVAKTPFLPLPKVHGQPLSPGFHRRPAAILCLAVLMLAAPVSPFLGAAPADREELRRPFEQFGVEGCFVLYDAATESFTRLDADRAERRFYPASTFKILNSLIALETGVLRDEHQVIPWDGEKRWGHQRRRRGRVFNI